MFQVDDTDRRPSLPVVEGWPHSARPSAQDMTRQAGVIARAGDNTRGAGVITGPALSPGGSGVIPPLCYHQATWCYIVKASDNTSPPGVIAGGANP